MNTFAVDDDEDDRCSRCRAINGFVDLPIKIDCYYCDIFKSWRKKNKILPSKDVGRDFDRELE